MEGLSARCGRLRSGCAAVHEGASGVACRQPPGDPLPRPRQAGRRRLPFGRATRCFGGMGGSGLASLTWNGQCVAASLAAPASPGPREGVPRGRSRLPDRWGLDARCGRLRSGRASVHGRASTVACRQPPGDPLPRTRAGWRSSVWFGARYTLLRGDGVSGLARLTWGGGWQLSMATENCTLLWQPKMSHLFGGLVGGGAEWLFLRRVSDTLRGKVRCCWRILGKAGRWRVAGWSG